LTPLLEALKNNSIDHVRQALEDFPEAAREPFWDHDCEPPLCCAVRFQCDASIIEVLLESQADMESADRHGRTPLQLLKEMEMPVQEQYWEMLLGCDGVGNHSAPWASDASLVIFAGMPLTLKSVSWYDSLLFDEYTSKTWNAREMWYQQVSALLL
jgi:hypothetical protein